MRTVRIFALMAALLSTAAVFTSCSSDDDDTGGQLESVNKNVVGVWYCTFQQWTEDGDTWSQTYEPSSQYVMTFDDDGTGYMQCGGDELFEIGCHKIENYHWHVYRKYGKNWIQTDVRNRAHDYEITHISSTDLTLTWHAPESQYGYTIVGKFKK